MIWYYGIRVKIKLGTDISKCLFVSGCYDPNEFYFLDKYLKDGMVFIDTGANIGLYSLFAAEKVGSDGKVISLEPSNREYIALQENISLNRMNNIIPLQYAAGNKNSSGILKISA